MALQINNIINIDRLFARLWYQAAIYQPNALDHIPLKFFKHVIVKSRLCSEYLPHSQSHDDVRPPCSLPKFRSNAGLMGLAGDCRERANPQAMIKHETPGRSVFESLRTFSATTTLFILNFAV